MAAFTMGPSDWKRLAMKPKDIPEVSYRIPGCKGYDGDLGMLIMETLSFKPNALEFQRYLAETGRYDPDIWDEDAMYRVPIWLR